MHKPAFISDQSKLYACLINLWFPQLDLTFPLITTFSSSRPSYTNQTFDGDLFESKILSSMSHENFGSYFCYNLPNNSIYRVWFFFSNSVLNLVECLKEIANGEYGITASFIGSIFTVSSYRISKKTNLFVQPSVKSFCSKGLKNEKCFE